MMEKRGKGGGEKLGKVARAKESAKEKEKLGKGWEKGVGKSWRLGNFLVILHRFLWRQCALSDKNLTINKL